MEAIPIWKTWDAWGRLGQCNRAPQDGIRPDQFLIKKTLTILLLSLHKKGAHHQALAGGRRWAVYEQISFYLSAYD
jgi:hypothetical protein